MKYLIKSLKWTKHYGQETWYRPDSNGYTYNIYDAGIYTENDMVKMAGTISEKVIKFIPLSEKLKAKGVKQLASRINQYKFEIVQAESRIKDATCQIELVKAQLEWFKNSFITTN